MNEHILIKKTHDVTLSPDILEALGLDSLFTMRDYTVTDYLTCDTDILVCRSLIFRDTLDIPGLLPLLYETVNRLTDIREIIRRKGTYLDIDRGLYALRQLELYFEVVDSMAGFYAEHRHSFTSAEYLDMFEALSAIASSEEYKALRRNTESMVEEVRNIKSITVGFNIDAALTPYEAGLLTFNDAPVESGSMLDRILRLDKLRHEEGRDSPRSMVPLVPARSTCTEEEYAALTRATYSALNKIFKKQARHIEPEVHQYLKKHLQFLIDLLPDFRFICDLSEIQKRFMAAKLPLCVPEFRPVEERCYTAEGLYNPILALHKFENDDKSPIISSDLSFDDRGGIYLLTGPNSGGKTVFLKSVGIAQIMAQIGMMVPAKHMTVSPVSGLFVEFPRYTTDRRAGGRLEYECADIQAIFRKLDAHALVLLDEAFSSTSPDEAVALAVEVLKALSLIGARGIYVSHYHLLTDRLAALNGQDFGQSRFDFLAADVREGDTRTFRITRRPPDGHSYADTIAARYGISAERLAAYTEKTQ